MAQTYYTLLTTRGFAAITNAVILKTGVDFAKMVVGDGNGVATIPAEGQITLVRETYRGALNSVTAPNESQILAELIIPYTVGGFTIREVGLLDANDNLLVAANFPATYKPTPAEGTTSDLVIRVLVNVGNASVVNVTVDPSAVIATRKWVMESMRPANIIPGGLTGQAFVKRSDLDGAVEWRTLGIADIDGLAAALGSVRLPVTHDLANLLPADGDHGSTLSPTLTGSVYYPLYGVPQARRRIQVIADGGNWDAPLYTGTSQPSGGVPAASHTVATPLVINTSYLWRYRDENTVGENSAWSEPTHFTTANVYIATPTIVGPANNAVDVAEQPVIQLSAFAVVGGADTHASSSVRIKDSTGAVVWSLIDSAGPLNNIVVPAGILQPGNKQYTIEGRHRGTTYGVSQWSAPTTITTSAAFLPDFNANIGMPYGGGYIAGVIKSDYDGNTYGIIVSPREGDYYHLGFQPSPVWPSGIAPPTPVAGVAPALLSDGYANTEYMIGIQPGTMGMFNSGTGLNGYKDWYIPSRDELSLIYHHLKPIGINNEIGVRSAGSGTIGWDGKAFGTNNNAVPALPGHTAAVPAATSVQGFGQNGAHNLYGGSDYGYWSSTLSGGGFSVGNTKNKLWTQNFLAGGQRGTQVDVGVYTRVIRRVLISTGG